jgi:hypothetical protein
MNSIGSVIESGKNFFAIVLLLILCFTSGFVYSKYKARIKYQQLLEESTLSSEELTITRNKVKNLNSVLSEKNQETEELKTIIRNYENKPEKIKYIVKTETILVGNEEIIKEPPEEYIYKFKNGLPVSKFSFTEEGYKFTTYDVTFETTTIISKDKTAITLNATSSLEPETKYKIPVSTEVIKIRDHKIFDPQLSIGFSQSNTFSPLDSNLYVSVYMPLIHINKNVDIVIPRISFNNQSTRIGMDMISYNIGDPIPLTTDLWIGAGISNDISNKTTGLDLTIGSKF